MSSYGERVPVGAGDACYRHPGRQSFVLCQRCGRTICPDCQTQSAVGVLCPHCMKESAPARKRQATAQGSSGAPVVTYAIMAVCGVVFAAQLLVPGLTQLIWFAPVYGLPGNFEPWRMVTSMFAHSTSFLPHILLNMYALWVFGRQLEQFFGRWRYLFLYLASGVAGSVVVLLSGYASSGLMHTAVVGASGAIFGVFAATFVVGRALGAQMTSLLVMLAINFAIGFMPGTNIAWQAHLGGLLGGAAVAFLLMRTRGPRRRAAQIAGLVGIAAALVLLSAAYFLTMPSAGVLLGA